MKIYLLTLKSFDILLMKPFLVLCIPYDLTLRYQYHVIQGFCQEIKYEIWCFFIKPGLIFRSGKNY